MKQENTSGRSALLTAGHRHPPKPQVTLGASGGLSRPALLVLACLQTVSTSGIIFGWSSLLPILVAEGQFSNLCPHDPGLQLEQAPQSCDAQMDALSNVFTMMTTVSLAAALPLGMFLDHFGPRKSVAFCFLVIAVGSTLVALSSSTRGQGLLLWGLAFVSIASPGVQTGLFHVSNLFPLASGVTTSMITGCFQVSMGLFTVFRFFYFHVHIPLSTLFATHACMMAAMAALSLAIWPDRPYVQLVHRKAELPLVSLGPPSSWASSPSGSPLGPSALTSPNQPYEEQTVPLLQGSVEQQGSTPQEAHPERSAATTLSVPTLAVQSLLLITPHEKSQPDSDLLALPVIQQDDIRVVERALDVVRASRADRFYNLSLREQLATRQYCAFAVFFAVHMTLANHYIGTMCQQLVFFPDADEAMQLHYVTIFGLLIAASALSNPVAGSIVDRCGLGPGGFMSVGLATAYAVCALVPLIRVQLATFLFYVVWRSFFFVFSFSYLSRQFGFANFGKLFGTSSLICGGAAMLNIPLDMLHGQAMYSSCSDTGADDFLECWLSEGFNAPNAIQLPVIVLSFVFPWAIVRHLESSHRGSSSKP